MCVCVCDVRVYYEPSLWSLWCSRILWRRNSGPATGEKRKDRKNHMRLTHSSDDITADASALCSVQNNCFSLDKDQLADRGPPQIDL